MPQGPQEPRSGPELATSLNTKCREMAIGRKNGNKKQRFRVGLLAAALTAVELTVTQYVRQC